MSSLLDCQTDSDLEIGGPGNQPGSELPNQNRSEVFIGVCLLNGQPVPLELEYSPCWHLVLENDDSPHPGWREFQAILLPQIVIQMELLQDQTIRPVFVSRLRDCPQC